MPTTSKTDRHRDRSTRRSTDKTPAELKAERQVQSLGVDIDAMAAVSNIFRVANAVRNVTERQLLDDHHLTFSGFTVLWVLWIWGPKESLALARESGVSKSTLTGIVKTLAQQSLVTREAHSTDGRRVIVKATRKGVATIRRIFPVFNAIEAQITSGLSGGEKGELARLLRCMLAALEDDSIGGHI